MGVLTDLVGAKKAAADWRDAIMVAGELLVGAGAVRPEYVDAMMRVKEELGPYIVIAPGVAMPHARPEAGVIKPGVSIVTLAAPVTFGHRDNDPVDVVIAFAAEDKDAHLETLRAIAGLVSDRERLDRVRSAQTDSELTSAIGE